MPRDAFVLKIQRELCHPKCARKVSGLSKNGPQFSRTFFKFTIDGTMTDRSMDNRRPCRMSYPTQFDLYVFNIFIVGVLKKNNCTALLKYSVLFGFADKWAEYSAVNVGNILYISCRYCGTCQLEFNRSNAIEDCGNLGKGRIRQ